ncbi:MAG: FkbM family methyltransferase [Pseudohongiella sp.]|nr:FkbM family methyltransferase [Pseudohongiella sp.]MDP2126922.1 FkbM family methyltransferase [Pseudohongiella sp.]
MGTSLKVASLQWLWTLQNYLPLKISQLVYKTLSKSGHTPALSFRCRFYGLEYEGNLNNNIDAAIYYYGAFEKPLLHFMGAAITAIAGKDGVFVDVGANIGQHSLYMSQTSKHVIAFEPFTPVRARLEHHKKLNRITNIEIHALGLSNVTEQQPFYAPSGANAGIGSFDPDSTCKGNKSIGALQLIRGDEFFDQCGLPQLHLIKIDVEGFEKKVLLGLRNTLTRFRPLIVCEMTYSQKHSFVSSREILDMLPDNYVLLCFNKRRPDGSKLHRKNAHARRSGAFQLVPYSGPQSRGQDDVILCPQELLATLPHTSRT